MELLKKLYEIYSPSKNEEPMRKFLKKYCKAKGYYVTRSYGNLYVTKGEAETYPCVCAHMDQVQKLHSSDFKALETDGVIFGYSSMNRRQEGLGADDKNGIWVALRCLEEFDVMKCAFFWGEEIGCLGSADADMRFFEDCRFALQVDRKNGGDLITDICGDLCSREFVKSLPLEKFGYKERDGLLTDVAELKGKGLKVSCVNMSCGYYEPHTDHEITVFSELQNCLEFVKEIISTCTDVYPHEQEHKGYGYWGFGAYRKSPSSKYCGSYYDDWYGDEYYDSQIVDKFEKIESKSKEIDKEIKTMTNSKVLTLGDSLKENDIQDLEEELYYELCESYVSFEEVYDCYHEFFPSISKEDFKRVYDDVALDLGYSRMYEEDYYDDVPYGCDEYYGQKQAILS